MIRDITCLVLCLLTLPGLAPDLSAEEGARTLRVLSYNIRHGEGVDGRVDLDRIAQVIARTKPDLVALQEIDRNCLRSGNMDIAQELGRRLKMESRFGAFMNFQGGQYGLAVLSRFPIRKTFRITLPPGPQEPRCALEIQVEPWPGRPPVSLVCIHNDWLQETARVSQVKALMAALELTGHPVILAGDFNGTSTSRSLQLLTGNGWNLIDKKGKNTFPSDRPTKEIDFIITRGFKDAVMESDVLEEKVASDHRPVFGRIQFPQ